MIEIRPVRATDADACVGIVAEVFREYGMTFAPEAWDLDLTRPHLHYAAPDATFVVAEDKGRVVAMVGGHLERAVGARSVTGERELATGRPLFAELHRLYLAPDARGLGLGARLCAEIEQWAKAAGASRMRLWSDVRFTHAHAMYRRRGYRITGSRTLGDPDRSVEFEMARELTEPECLGTQSAGAQLWPSVRTVSAASARRDAELWHHARFAAVGIVDARRLVGAGRMRGDAHELPEPSELLGIADSELELLVADPLAVVGFRSARAGIVWHPSCQP